MPKGEKVTKLQILKSLPCFPFVNPELDTILDKVFDDVSKPSYTKVLLSWTS